MKYNQMRQVVFPILAAFIWGTAFVAQDLCADSIGAFAFNATRYFIAVLALIELILKYDGADFANWPGLARCKVHFALFDAMQKQGQIWENEAQVDTESAAGTELLEACRDADGSLDELARLLLSLDLQEALRQLNPDQRQVMMLLFAQELKPSEAAKRLGCSVRNVTKHRLKALDKLRGLL